MYCKNIGIKSLSNIFNQVLFNKMSQRNKNIIINYKSVKKLLTHSKNENSQTIQMERYNIQIENKKLTCFLGGHWLDECCLMLF